MCESISVSIKVTGPGEFYTSDCICNQRQQLCYSGDLYGKAWQLVGKLPIFVISSNVSVSIGTKCVDVKDVQKRLADKFSLVVLRYITLSLIARPVNSFGAKILICMRFCYSSSRVFMACVTV